MSPTTTLSRAIGRLAAESGGLERRTLKEQLVHLLREAIVTGLIPPETRLIEREISEQLGISRLPVRDALNQLEGEGLVISTETGRKVIDLDETVVRELYELRLALESLAVRLATERMVPEDGALLEARLEAMRTALAAGNRVAYGRHDLELHQLIWRYAGNRFVERDLNILGRPVAFLAARFADADVLHVHEQLVERMLAGDACGAQETMTRHMEVSIEDCQRALQEGGVAGELLRR